MICLFCFFLAFPVCVLIWCRIVTSISAAVPPNRNISVFLNRFSLRKAGATPEDDIDEEEDLV